MASKRTDSYNSKSNNKEQGLKSVFVLFILYVGILFFTCVVFVLSHQSNVVNQRTTCIEKLYTGDTTDRWVFQYVVLMYATNVFWTW